MEMNVVDTGDSLMVRPLLTLRDLGQSVIDTNRLVSNGVGQMIDDVIERARRPKVITVLRIYSHGMSGATNVAGGQVDASDVWGGIALSNVQALRGTLGRLTPYFSPGARVEFHGCEVAEGSDGEKLLRELARIWQVRVQASARGSPISALNFTGAVVEADPAGGLRTVVGVPVPRIKASGR